MHLTSPGAAQFQVLHRGCVSSVYLGNCPFMMLPEAAPAEGRRVIKVYHKNCALQSRHWVNISREVAILQQLRRLRIPGVVQLHGTSDNSCSMCLVFEHCSGGDLYKRLAHCGLLSEAQLCTEILIPLLKVLVSLHDLGIIHRDIKPENIFFDAAGALRLGDFGLAINRYRDRPTSRVGTADYMAPEVLAQPSADLVALRGLKPCHLPSYNTSVDIWALGVLVYECIMGITPFGHADPEMAALNAQFRRPAPLRPGVSAACADFVCHALAKQAAQRPTALQLLGHPWLRGYMSIDDVLAYNTAAADWGCGIQGKALIKRWASCPVVTADTAPAVPPTTPEPETEPAGNCSHSDSNRFVNLLHHLQQTLIQQQTCSQQQHLQHMGPKMSPSAFATATRCAAAAADGGLPTGRFVPLTVATSLHSAQPAACLGSSADQMISQTHSSLPRPAANRTPRAVQPLASMPMTLGRRCAALASPAAGASAAVPIRPAMQRLGEQGVAYLAAAPPGDMRAAAAALSTSVPASPVATPPSAGSTYWLLSPQHVSNAAKQTAGGLGWHVGQPAVLAGFPVYLAEWPHSPAAAAAAAAAAAGGGTGVKAISPKLVRQGSPGSSGHLQLPLLKPSTPTATAGCSSSTSDPLSPPSRQPAKSVAIQYHQHLAGPCPLMKANSTGMLLSALSLGVSGAQLPSSVKEATTAVCMEQQGSNIAGDGPVTPQSAQQQEYTPFAWTTPTHDDGSLLGGIPGTSPQAVSPHVPAAVDIKAKDTQQLCDGRLAVHLEDSTHRRLSGEHQHPQPKVAAAEGRAGAMECQGCRIGGSTADQHRCCEQLTAQVHVDVSNRNSVCSCSTVVVGSGQQSSRGGLWNKLHSICQGRSKQRPSAAVRPQSTTSRQ